MKKKYIKYICLTLAFVFCFLFSTPTIKEVSALQRSTSTNFATAVIPASDVVTASEDEWSYFDVEMIEFAFTYPAINDYGNEVEQDDVVNFDGVTCEYKVLPCQMEDLTVVRFQYDAFIQAHKDEYFPNFDNFKFGGFYVPSPVSTNFNTLYVDADGYVYFEMETVENISFSYFSFRYFDPSMTTAIGDAKIVRLDDTLYEWSTLNIDNVGITLNSTYVDATGEAVAGAYRKTYNNLKGEQMSALPTSEYTYYTRFDFNNFVSTNNVLLTDCTYTDGFAVSYDDDTCTTYTRHTVLGDFDGYIYESIYYLVDDYFLTLPYGYELEYNYTPKIADISGYVEMDTDYSKYFVQLLNDENFVVKDYSSNPADFSLDVVQVIETDTDEVLLCVYRPSALNPALDLRASSVNIATEYEQNDKVWKKYALTFLDNHETLDIYRIDGFTKLSADVRTYDISNLLRPWIKGLDGESGTTNTISEVRNSIGKVWIYKDDGDETFGQMTYTDVVLITDFYTDKIRLADGWHLISVQKTDSHFIAFSTDRDIDKLYEVDIEFTLCPYTRVYPSGDDPDDLGVSKDYGTEYVCEPNPYTLTYEQVAENEADGWFSKEYSWNRILSSTDYLKTDVVVDALGNNETAKETISKHQWVLSFYETDYSLSTASQQRVYEEATDVKNVVILRLKFEENGDVYNLGAVSNVQTGDHIPDGETDAFDDFLDDFQAIIRIILFILLIAVCLPFLTPIVNILWTVAKFVINVVWWLVTLPFKLIATLFKK